ncbi:hypothetical protein QF004_002805, partial [Chryseobacterium sp. MDT2-18]|nr:hypothetical protein [Chryseobacterium sp. MDT2-18]
KDSCGSGGNFGNIIIMKNEIIVAQSRRLCAAGGFISAL